MESPQCDHMRPRGQGVTKVPRAARGGITPRARFLRARPSCAPPAPLQGLCLPEPKLMAADLAALVRKHQLKSVYIGTDSPQQVDGLKRMWATLDVRWVGAARVLRLVRLLVPW